MELQRTGKWPGEESLTACEGLAAPRQLGWRAARFARSPMEEHARSKGEELPQNKSQTAKMLDYQKTKNNLLKPVRPPGDQKTTPKIGTIQRFC